MNVDLLAWYANLHKRKYAASFLLSSVLLKLVFILVSHE